MDSITSLCSKFDVDAPTVIAILYCEKIQYELDVFRKGKRRLERLVSTFPDFMGNLYTWSQLTAGYTHIKESFALETKKRLDQTEKFNGFLSNTDIEPSSYISNPSIALSITVAGLAMLVEEWRSDPHGCDISAMPGIVATLYNIGYVNSHPHKSPKTGGSIMPIIIDGYIIPGHNFGDRVNMLIEESVTFKAFIDKSI